MKISLFGKNSKALLVLLIIITILSIRSGKYTYLSNIIFFASLFLIYKPSISYIFIFYLQFSLLLIVIGILNNNNFTDIISDFISFTPIILLFFLNSNILKDLNQRLPSFLANALYILIPISILIYGYMDYKPGSFETARFIYNEDTKLHLMGPIIPLSHAPYLVFYIDYLNRNQKIVVYISIILMALFGITTLTRAPIINALLPLILLFIFKISQNKINIFKVLRTIFVLTIACFIIYQTPLIKKEILNESIEGLIMRNEISKESGLYEEGRFEETKTYLNQNLSFLEIILGRGMGGKKTRNVNSYYIGGIGMMHFGPSHVFLKGGILFVLILYIPLFLSIAYFWKTNMYQISLILIYFLIINLINTTWDWGVSTFFYWYAITMYYISKRNKIQTLHSGFKF